MKTKIKNNKIFITLLCFMMAIAALFGVKMSVETTHAATSTSAKYKTYGTYSTGGGYTTGCPSYFSVYMYSSTQNGSSGTIYDDQILNWTYVNIYMDVSDMKSHSSFKLYRNGSLYTNKTLSGASDQTLYAGALSDGEYELVYVGTYKKNIFTSAVTYTYKYSFVIDKSAPTYSLKEGATTVYSGAYVNEQITYSISDYDPYRIYYKKPGYSSYYSTTATSYSVAATTANNGLWEFYAQDGSYNTSSTVWVYLDTIPAVGKVTNSDGTTIANGGYTNKPIKYTATDSGSGVSSYQVKKPGATSWVSYTAGTALSGTYGWYEFRCYDRSSNVSEIIKVYYDGSAPLGTLYAGTTAKGSGSYVNAEYIKYVANDSNSTIANCYVKMPNASYYTAYASGTQLSMEGKYFFYSVDKSGNSSSVLTITLDKTKGYGLLYGGNSVVANGSATNAESIRFIAYDNIGVKDVYVKLPGASSYTSYTSGTRYTAEGEYLFYVVDYANNMSEIYSILLNRKIPAAQLYVDDMKIGNNSYTNGWHIRFECEETCYVKLPNTDEFIPYMSGSEYYKLGKYVFFGEDEAGNSTGYYTIVIDKTSKSLQVSNVVAGVTNGDVVLDWTNGDPNVYAPVKSVTVNGKLYIKGSVIHTIDTGTYHVVCTDYAGNTWETEFRSTKVNVLTKTLQQQYFEVFDANGDYYSFTSYESALEFATLREKSFIRTGNWHNTDWDTGIAMDAKDAENAKNGNYMIYKKEGNAEAEVAYFTEERINEVIAQYAKQGINSYYYWEKEPLTSAEGENLYAYSDTKKILAKSIEFCEFVGCKIDGAIYTGNTYSVDGKHHLVIFDEWNNTCDYDLIVVQNPAEIYYTVGDGSANLVVYDRTYHFKSGVSVSISDDLDEYAMFIVYDGEGELLGKFLAGEVYSIDKSGRYTVQSVNHFGLSEIFDLVISLSAPESSIIENVLDKKLEVKITESADVDSHIQTLEIYKSHDNGTTWTLVSHDDYGTPVSLETLNYAFRTTAMYKVVLTDEFRTGIDAIEQELNYVQPEPYGVLKGTTNGGYTNSSVSFVWTDEAQVTLERGEGLGRETMLYKSGQELTIDGTYTLTFENYDGYKMVYTFTIDTINPMVEIQGVSSESIKTKNDVSMTIAEEGLITELFKNGESLGAYTSGTVLSEDGEYRLMVKDFAENQVEIIFIIDKSVDYSINVNDKGLANEVVISANEDVTLLLKKDGVEMEYELECVIAEPGQYDVTVFDAIGNQSEMSFIVVKPLVTRFEHNFDDMSGFEKALVNGSEKRLNYGTLELFEDGTYEVGVVANGQTYTFTVTVDGTKPELTITGVENGGTTEGGVVLNGLSEEANVQVYLNDEKMLYKLGEELTMEGKYKVVVTDTCGNISEYSFQIKKSNSTSFIALGIIGAIGVVGIVVFAVLKKKRKI